MADMPGRRDGSRLNGACAACLQRVLNRINAPKVESRASSSVIYFSQDLRKLSNSI